jgi:hypothetical protein
MKSNSVEQDFKSKKILYESLFIFLGGYIGDIFIHIMMEYTRKNSYKFAHGLENYYKSLEYGNTYIKRTISSYILGAVFGGLACITALFIMKLFIFSLESTNNGDNDKYIY